MLTPSIVPDAKVRGRLAVYAITIFFSSAGLMALEIAAARLLAPYIGVSLYSWTAIIGVILGGLSLGSWLGGVWADRGAGEEAAGWTLGLGAIACSGVLLLLTVIAPLLQGSELGLLSISFLFVAALFFLPAVLIGIVTPLLTTLALHLDTRTGHIVGMMHALAAFGSIAGTFATGYLFIQYFGTQAVILGTAAILGLQAIWFLWHSRKALASLAVAAVALLGWTAQRNGFVPYCDRETSYFCIRVLDMSEAVRFGEVRAMILDHLVHGVNHRQQPSLLLSPYAHLMDELIAQHHNDKGRPLRAFFAGGGAYTQPRALRSHQPDAEIVIAELDPAVTEVARAQLFYDAAADRIIHSDARRVLTEQSPQYFDVVVGDVFHDIAIPHHLVTVEYARLVRTRLVDDGMYILNVIDAHPDPLLVKSISKTLGEVFPHVQIWLDEWPAEPARMTYVLAASAAAPTAAGTHRSRRGPLRRWQEVTRQIAASGTPLAALPVLTDDLAPVEQLLSSLVFGELGR